MALRRIDVPEDPKKKVGSLLRCSSCGEYYSVDCKPQCNCYQRHRFVTMMLLAMVFTYLAAAIFGFCWLVFNR